MNSTSSHWSSWIQDADTNPLHAWSNVLRLGTHDQVRTLPRQFSLKAQEHQQLRNSLLTDRVLDTRALDRLMYLESWPVDWLADLLSNHAEKALKGGRLEAIMDWWMSIPLEPVDEPFRHEVLAQARRPHLKTLIDSRGKGNREWEVLARLNTYDESWGRQHGASGCWAGVVLEFTPEGQQIDSTRHWPEDALCLGLRVAMNQAHCRNLIWGSSEHLPTSAWQQWEKWLAASPNRQSAWDRIVREEAQDTQLAQDWTHTWFPNGRIEDSLLLRQSKDGTFRINEAQVLEHPYWGVCAQVLDVTSKDRTLLIKSLLDIRQFGDRGIPLAHRAFSAWLATMADARAAEGDTRLFEAYSNSPAGRRVPCAPTLMSLGAISKGPWIKQLAMKSEEGTAQLLDALRDDRVALMFELSPEDLIQWLSGPHGEQVRAWRNGRGDHLLSLALPPKWRGMSKPPLSPSLAKGYLEVAPEWMMEPTSVGGCLLDFPLTERGAQAYIRQQALARIAQHSNGRATGPDRRM